MHAQTVLTGKSETCWALAVCSALTATIAMLAASAHQALPAVATASAHLRLQRCVYMAAGQYGQFLAC